MYSINKINTPQKKFNISYISLPEAQTSSIQLWFSAGSALENPDEYGIAHFLEHMFFKGNKEIPGLKMTQDIERWGGEINAFTSFDYTCYYINCPNQHTSKALHYLLNMVTKPLFSKKHIDSEIDVVLEEYYESQDRANSKVFEKIQSQVFSPSYKHPILGLEKTIKKFNKDQLKSFWKKHYNKSNLNIVIAGNIEKKESSLSQIVDQFQLYKGEPNIFPKTFKASSRPALNFVHYPYHECSLTFSTGESVKSFREALISDLAIQYIFMSETTELYQELCHHLKVVTSINASSLQLKNGLLHTFRINFSQENTIKAIESFFHLLEKEISAETKKDRLERTKNQFLASKFFEAESIETIATNYGYHLSLYDMQEDANEKLKEIIEELKPSDITNKLIEIFKKPLQTVFHDDKTVKINTSEIQNLLREKLNSFSKNIQSLDQQHSPNKRIKILKRSKYTEKAKLYELSNKRRFFHFKSPHTETFNLHFYLPGGIVNEDSQNNGLYHLTSRLLTYSSNDYSYTRLKDSLDLKASYLSSFSGKHSYGITLSGMTKYFDENIKILKDVLYAPLFDATFLEVEKNYCFKSIESRETDPSKKCFSLFKELMFKNHPYSKNTTGSKESLELIKRDHLHEAHQKSLSLGPSLISLSTGLDFDEVSQVISKYFDSDLALKNQNFYNNHNVKNDRHDNSQDFFFMDKEQVHCVIGFEGYSLKDKDSTLKKVLQKYLSGQGADLFIKLREEEGLVYSCYPLSFSGLEGGYFGIYFSSSKQKVSQAYARIHELIDKLMKNGISQKAYNDTVNAIKGELQLYSQTNEDFCNIYSFSALHYLDLEHPYKEIELLQKYDFNKFKKFLVRLFKRRKVEVAVGPKSPFSQSSDQLS